MNKPGTNQSMPNDQTTLSGGYFPMSKDKALEAIVETYLENNPVDAFSNIDDIVQQIGELMHHEFRLYNETAPKGSKLRAPSNLTPDMIARVMMRMYCIRNINCAGVNSEEEYDILGIYQEDGPDKGIYISKERDIRRIIHKFNPGLDSRHIKDTISILSINAPRVERCSDPDLIAVNNGIFNYKTKIVEPFSSERVFTAKCRVDYNPAATNVVIHNNDGTDWDVESWIKELFDDPEIAECIWQIMGAIIRPNVRWGKAAWFVSDRGNNGKGTLCHLMRNLAGFRSCVAIPLSDFGKDFMLEPLIQATSIITDENDVGTFIDKAANLKAIITNDVIQVNRKFKPPIAYQFKGFMVQCLNSTPRTKDRSDSFYRRCLFIPFTKCYTGIERKYIKDDYLNRTDVLEYVLYRVLNMNYYEITEPEACKAALNEYKEFNDPVRQFLLERTKTTQWSFIASTILFEMYKYWSQKNNENGSVGGRNQFLANVNNIITSIDGWHYVDSKHAQRVSGRMDADEPFLDENNCVNLMENEDTPEGRVKIKATLIRERMGGIFRDDTAGIGSDTVADNTDGNSND